MQNITFEQLPQAVQNLAAEVRKLHNLVAEKLIPPIQPEKYYDIDELIDYLPVKIAKPTVYGKVSAKKIPFKKRGKKLYFLKSEIDAWLSQGK